ncbi:MAG: flagellar biosynthetic protein FliR [Gracilibacteraceae bacterium]|jgi:flagellar biosynthetic protein FliR|nr:flagellar biosynthetic protein FliR [Gracilibacteraceae bacterium]
MEVTLDELIFWIFIMARLSGMVLFNSIFGRVNIPAMFRAGLVVVLTVLAATALPAPRMAYMTWVSVALALGREFLIGFTLGYFINAVMSLLMLAGELVDLQMGIAMAKMYDPASNVNMPIVGSVFNAMFLLLFFISNAHLTFLQIVISSFRAVPVGVWTFSADLPLYAVTFFGSILTLAAKMALPLIVIHLMTEVAIGIIMKAIPQINVFVLNIEMKMIVGYIVIFVLTPSYSGFLDEVLIMMLRNLDGVLGMFQV